MNARVLFTSGLATFLILVGCGEAVVGPESGGVRATAPSPTPPGEGQWVAELMDSLPASMSSRGVWFANFGKAFRESAVNPPGSLSEPAAVIPEHLVKHRDARQGVYGSALLNIMAQHEPVWEDTFGFGGHHVDVVASSGDTLWDDSETNLMVGEFDPQEVSDALGGLGYDTVSYSGLDYWLLPDGVSPSVPKPLGALVRHNIRAVYAEADLLAASPNGEQVAGIVAVRAGEAPSLSEDRAFSSLALVLGDPLSVILLSRKSVLTPQNPFPREYLPQPIGWNPLGEWEALGLSYSRTPGETQEGRIALWYPDGSFAEKGAGELLNRITSYEFPPEPPGFMFLQESCEGMWEARTVSFPSAGGVAVVSCRIPRGGESQNMGAMLWNIVGDGTFIGLLADM